jgi:peptidoglycan/LPS O-acetylase OafA/YrhL
MWRGAACLAVVVYHSCLYYPSIAAPPAEYDPADAVLRATSGLWQGVPLFFVISGYCIAATADRSRRESGAVGSYFTRRFWRIYPPYWAIILLSIILVAAVDVALQPGLLSSPPRSQLRPWWFSASQWVGNVTLTETWRPYLFGSSRAHFVGQSWTLCYEEQFYLVVGLILVFTARRLFLAASLVTVASFAVQLFAAYRGTDVSGFFFDGSWLMFAAGILVYYHLNYAGRIAKLISFAVLSLAVLTVGWGGVTTVEGSTSAFAFALLIIVLRRWDARIADCRWLAPLAWCGTICYSLYLAHALLVRIAQKAFYSAGVTSSAGTLFVVLPCCVLVSLLAGHAFYMMVERRFMPSRNSVRASHAVPTVPATRATAPAVAGGSARFLVENAS